MADPVIAAPAASAAPASPAPAPVPPPAAPAAATTPATPLAAVTAIEATSTASPPAVEVAQPTTEAAKPVEAKPAEAKSSFLSDAKTEAKPAVAADPAKPTTEAKPAESIEPAAPIVYEPFKVPEGFSLDEGRLGAFTEALQEFKAPQGLGQKMIDLYTSEVQRLAEHQQTLWDRTQETWLNEVRSDPTIGGNRIETTARTCGAVIERFGSPALREALAMSGMGNHPEMVRFVAKIGTFLQEGKPVPAPKPAPTVSGPKGMRRYNGTTPAGAPQS